MDGTSSTDGSRRNVNSPHPLISFIIPVYNAGAYLGRCLESITRQSFRDFEIIAVDGASTDKSARALEEYRSAEPRLRVQYYSKRIGPGKARNLGVEQARGEYLWFVDADDTIATGCLGLLADTVKVAAPDVALVHYLTVQPHRMPEPGPLRALPDRETAACFTITDHPEVLSMSMASWNKVVRREFLRALGIGFSREWPHEDVALSAQLLLEARKLSLLDQPCYRYRKNRPGSAMRRPNPRGHFNIFDAWQAVLHPAQMRAKGDDPIVTPQVYLALFERAMWHYSTILDAGGFGVGRVGMSGYIARIDRREFFALMAEDFNRFAPSGYQPGGGFRGMKFKLIMSGDYRTYSILDPLNKIRNAVRLASRVTISKADV